MFSVKGDATIATVTDLRRAATELLDRAMAGESVVVQRNAEPVGVLLDFNRYQQMVDAEEQLENLQFILLALKREADIVSGRDTLVPIEEIMTELGMTDQEDADELGEAV